MTGLINQDYIHSSIFSNYSVHPTSAFEHEQLTGFTCDTSLFNNHQVWNSWLWIYGKRNTVGKMSSQMRITQACVHRSACNTFN